ncbi:MAG: hypothetical protein J6331_05035, partial [Lentisphaeria bacterium]|nr:hypothetical protein [Lentisphaeria bacterium]
MTLRDMTKFFRIRTHSAFLDLAGRGLALIPHGYTQEALSLLLRADLFLNKRKLTEREFEDLIVLVARQEPSGDAERIVSKAYANANEEEKSLLCAEMLASLPLEKKLDFASLLLEFDKSYLPAGEEAKREFSLIAEKLGLREKFIGELLARDAKRRSTAARVLNSGAGLAVALIVLLLFLLAATFLRSLFFGILLAYLFLPLEKYFETRFFRSSWVVFLSKTLGRLFRPAAALKNRLKKPKIPLTRAEHVRAEKKSLILKSTIATFFSLLVMVLLVLFLLAVLIVPKAMTAGRELKETVGSWDIVKKSEKLARDIVLGGEKTVSPGESVKKDEEKFPEGDPEAVAKRTKRPPSGKETVRELLRELRPRLKEYASRYKKELASFAFAQGKGVLSAVIGTAKILGNFLFDLLLMVFFFLYFLQQMAFFTDSVKAGKKQKEKLQSAGTWAVKGILDSSWLPAVSQETREEAISIIDNICNMFRCWARGYITIILIEAPLYVILFSLLSVPYGVVLGLVSSSPVLLTVLGLAGCFT